MRKSLDQTAPQADIKADNAKPTAKKPDSGKTKPVRLPQAHRR